ncbi:MAG: polysaccharide pyruvyl transferase family protein [Eubacterium sp.]|nr:polysaccharide pyruvyl transferase family protein [Eubacterium sp.]
MKILILNQHSINKGDEAAGTAVINNLLRIKGIEKIEILYCKPDSLPIDSEKVIHNHDLNVRRFRKRQFWKYILTGKTEGAFLPEFIEKLKEYDKVIVSPCGANLGIYKDWALLMQDVVAVKNKKRIIFHLNTIGKSGKILFDKLVLYVCRRAQVYVREKKSFEYLKSKKIDVKFGTDSAFSLKSNNDKVLQEDKIAFIPSDIWNWHVNFKGKNDSIYFNKILPSICKFACDNNLKIEIIPHITLEKERIFNEETKKALEGINPNVKVEIIDLKDCFEYERHICESKLLIGMRYHATVFASKNAVPFVGLAYEQKMLEVAQYTKQENSVIDLNNTNEDTDFASVIENTWNNREEIRKTLSKQSRELIEKSLIVLKDNFDYGIDQWEN